ncbi:peroxisomal hydratase-dehydrogenase-epimerase [Talaromyces proteolyticus]|uniref:Peroxisomal hydratase-dehydrogenase-epimerase n=1 Tax=Talaromyces proteolyticus TaxID=1131652 RepID=A0AAD4Q364_9EURO|nr:peroxisomal hydratase-dehydrogenase-epimerase [Talaromyces proteolyticus]KAH8701106.1 peroxisomal hydratase-dehydrogenase-epimerase [Talaromyces proteolyticus]
MASTISFQGQTVIVTGTETSVGKALARLFAQRGAQVVAASFGVPDGSRAIVDEINVAGGKVVPADVTFEDAAKAVQTAIEAFGCVDIIINHSDLARDSALEKMAEDDWESLVEAYLRASFRVTRAAWPYMKKQKLGRIVSTTSPAGLYGSINQSNLSAAQLGLVGFTETIAREGAKYNILANVVSLLESNQAAASLLPDTVRSTLGPEAIAPVIAVLAHISNKETGSIFETGGGDVAKLRWERASGALLRTDETLTPSAILHRWNEVVDFRKPEFPKGGAGIWDKLQASRLLPANPQGEEPQFDGKVAVITGGGAGLGRAYCLLFARLGAAVVVNDFKDPESVVKEIRSLGGKAVASNASVEHGDQVVKAAVEHFGRIDILVNNAGILRDKSITNTTDKDWTDVYQVHLKGTYSCTRAAYPYMVQQGYGRIINTSSTSGIYGNFGQTNYATAKAAILGFSCSLAVEGAKYNIRVNTIAPTAGTQLTKTVMPEIALQALKPDYIASLVVLLCSDKLPARGTGLLFEVGGGFHAQTRWRRSGGRTFGAKITPERIAKDWSSVVNFADGHADHPTTLTEALERFAVGSMGSGVLERIEKAKSTPMKPVQSSWIKRDVLLYNISLGARSDQLELVYENHPNFHVVPAFGVIPQFTAKASFNYPRLLPNFNPALLLHGEQYLEIRKFPIPTAAEVINSPELLEVVDKGNAAVIYTGITTKDAKTGEDIFYSESASFVRKSGGFGGQTKPTDRGDATATFQPPSRTPDLVLKEKTSPDQAALYRLNGDYNPLHVDPSISKKGGFLKPILHGLCTFGITAKHISEAVGPFKSIKARFSGTVLPGQTLLIELWKEKDGVIFQTKVEESGKLAISGGGARLYGAENARL